MRAHSDAVELELYSNRFTAMTWEMGELMRRVAISTNVKERLDYSCGLLDPDGRLVVNAPHIPVHLGALGLCVRSVARDVATRAGRRRGHEPSRLRRLAPARHHRDHAGLQP